MDIELIGIGTYNRAEHFEHFMKHSCSITISTNIDISMLRKYIRRMKFKTYPVLIWVVSNAVNAVPECRTMIDCNGRLARYKKIDPAYIAWNDETNSIYCLSTPFTSNINEFYKNCVQDIDKNRNKGMFPQGKAPSNTFSISASSKIQFTSMSINVHKMPLTPIITLGRIYTKWFKSYLPISIQVNHACCDGYHITRILEEINKTIKNLSLVSL